MPDNQRSREDGSLSGRRREERARDVDVPWHAEGMVSRECVGKVRSCPLARARLGVGHEDLPVPTVHLGLRDAVLRR